eukprot:581642-Rhodomonas_salina.2
MQSRLSGGSVAQWEISSGGAFRFKPGSLQHECSTGAAAKIRNSYPGTRAMAKTHSAGGTFTRPSLDHDAASLRLLGARAYGSARSRSVPITDSGRLRPALAGPVHGCTCS